MNVRLAAGLLAALVAATAPAQTPEGPAKWLGELEKKFPPADKNAAAEQVERLALALGVDRKTESKVPDDHPAKEDLDLYRQAGFLSWLQAQVKTSDDSIAPPSPGLKGFLERQQSVLSHMVSVLLRDVPDWGFHARERPFSPPDLMLVVRVNHILLSAALVEEHAGRHADAGQLLEASWSLTQSLASRPELISQLISISLSKLQMGVLRKMAEPSFEWLDRMSGDEPWNQVIDSFENDPLVVRAAVDTPPPPGSFLDTWSRGLRAAGEEVRERPACQLSNLSVEDMWEPVHRELAKWKEEGKNTDQAAEVFMQGSAENFLQLLRRAARLRVDREFTAKILELRQEKAAARDHRWPARFLDTGSGACPEAQYQYEPRGATMVVRFRGSIEDPAAPALVLPLSFEARAPRPTPTPTHPPRRAPTPAPHS